jgi:uncharacterized membrane protein YdjX (TVP38/TMEM64 family)
LRNSYQPRLELAKFPRKRFPIYLRIAIAAAIVAGLVILGRYFGAAHALASVLDWVHSLGAIAPLVFILIYIAACIAFVPGAILTIGAGVLFGPLWGSIYASIAATTGATCAFLIGRYLVRGAIVRRLAHFPRWSAIDAAIGERGWKIVGLIRLSPIFPFNLLNYAFGLTRVSLRDYVLASWAGMLPATVMYVYIGAVAGDLTVAAGAASRRTPQWWVIDVVGLIATIAVALYAAHIARRVLRHQPGSEKVIDGPTDHRPTGST